MKHGSTHPISEKEFQQQIIQLAHLLGWKVAHFRKVRVQRADGATYYETPAAADGNGWVDLVLVRDRIIHAELKRESGRLEPEQVEWKALLLAAGAEYYCWRPSNWPEIERILQ